MTNKANINIAIVGAAGRMGNMLVKCAMRLEGMKLVAAVDIKGHPALGRDAGVLAGAGDAGVPLTASVEAVDNADAFVVFSLHDSIPGTASVVAGKGKALVIGTTGLNEAETDAVRKAAKAVPVVWAPNMSLGVNLLFAMVRKAAEVLAGGYRAEIDETHHVHKKDAPSGTALRLGEKVAEGRGIDLRAAMKHVEGDAPADAGEKGILIRSHRRGEVVGDHTVSFENIAERIELTHHAHSREAFALGALHAARWAINRPAGLYDMQDVLGL